MINLLNLNLFLIHNALRGELIKMYYKYRGKSINEDIWIEGFPHKISKANSITEIISIQDGNIYQVNTETVGLAINYRDHSGTEIFTGDVVQFSQSGYQYNYLVWFCNEMQCLEAIYVDDLEDVYEIRAIAQYIETEPKVSNKYDYHNHKNSAGSIPHWEYFCEMLQDPCGNFNDIHVIGNIFDNPKFVERALIV